MEAQAAMAMQLIAIINGEHIDVTEQYLQAQEATREQAERNKLSPHERLKTVLRAHDTELCECGHEIGFGDIAWNNGCTEYGTGYSSVEIQCVGCDREIAHIDSWYPEIEDKEDLLHVLERDWGEHI